jgi:hypothetical protein
VIVSGTPTRYRSSAKVLRTFCGACGTPLTYAHDDFPTGVDVTVCSLDDPEGFPPADHTWVSHRLRWLRADDHLPALPELARRRNAVAWGARRGVDRVLVWYGR